MRHTEKQVFTLVSRFNGNRYPVQFWADYGVVAPLLWTTNGTIGYAARLCSEHLAHGSYTVEESTLAPSLDFTDPAALSEALLSAYQEWMAALQSPPTMVLLAQGPQPTAHEKEGDSHDGLHAT